MTLPVGAIVSTKDSVTTFADTAMLIANTMIITKAIKAGSEIFLFALIFFSFNHKEQKDRISYDPAGFAIGSPITFPDFPGEATKLGHHFIASKYHFYKSKQLLVISQAHPLIGEKSSTQLNR